MLQHHSNSERHTLDINPSLKRETTTLNIDMLRSLTVRCYHSKFFLLAKGIGASSGFTFLPVNVSLYPTKCKALGAYIIIVIIPVFITIKVESVLAVFCI